MSPAIVESTANTPVPAKPTPSNAAKIYLLTLITLILGVPLGRMVATVTDWRAIYRGIGLVCALGILAVTRLIPPTEGETPVPLGEQLALLKNPRIALALGVSLVLFTGYSTVYT